MTVAAQQTFEIACLKDHTQKVSRDEMISLFGLELVQDLESGEHAGTLLLPMDECYECTTEDRTEIVKLAGELDWRWERQSNA